MKKLFLFLSLSVLALSINSCSDDDSSSTNDTTSYVKFKVDGVQKNFTNITIVEQDYDAITITAQDGESISEKVVIEININSETNTLVEDELFFRYYEAGMLYDFVGAGTAFDYETEIYTMERAKGVFTGIMGNYNGGEMEYRTFTEGSFDIKIDNYLQ